MLNLSQIQSQVKRGGKFSPTGDAFAQNDLYKALKAHGWQSLDKVHLTDRVSLFQLGSATIRRDHDAAPGNWIVEIQGGTYHVAGPVDLITAEILRLEAEAEAAQAAPLSAAQQIALDLKTEYADYPELHSRIDKGAALVEAGPVEFPKYNTRYSPETFYGLRECDCPDVQNRDPRAKFGSACKHCFAQEIAHRVENERRATAYRKLDDRLQADRARRLATQGSYEAALRADTINRKAPHYAQHNGIGHR